LLWQQNENDRCSACGTHPDDWDPKRGGHPHAYVAAIVDCPGCAATEGGKTGRLKKDLDASSTARVGLKRQVPREV
jgi:hypothetical protein